MEAQGEEVDSLRYEQRSKETMRIEDGIAGYPVTWKGDRERDANYMNRYSNG